jgi:hypothetical protein
VARRAAGIDDSPAMTPKLRSVALVALVSWFPACDGDDGDPEDLAATGNVGPEGGSVGVAGGPLDGASIQIPAGALTTEIALSFFEDQVSLEPGFTDVGPALRIDPEGLALSLPALLTLPFDPTLVPPVTGPTDFVVRYRLVDGRVFEALPRQVDQSIGRVTLDVMQFATWWVSVPDAIATRDYLPLSDGDVYQYDTGLLLTVAETAVEPNFLGVRMTKLTFSTPFLFFEGLYVDYDDQDALSLLGEFEVANDNRQERLDGPALLLDAVEVVGVPRSVIYTFDGFIPYGGLVPAYLGTGQATVVVRERTSLVTPAGIFDDVVLLEIGVSRSDSRPRSTSFTLRFWLARNVGPVQLQVNQDRPHPLAAFTVAGAPAVR